MTYLLDAHVLISMAIAGHVHRERCLQWFSGIQSFATCPASEGTFLRVHMQLTVDPSPAAAWRTLMAYRSHPRHVFWPDDFPITEIDPTRLTDHRQITGSSMAELARRKGGKLATLDEALYVLWPDSTFLVPV
jgi:predicted nucleic acid-binding protein